MEGMNQGRGEEGQEYGRGEKSVEGGKERVGIGKNLGGRVEGIRNIIKGRATPGTPPIN